MDESKYDGNDRCEGGCGKREELEIRAKLFLQDFDSESAADAIEAVLKHIGEGGAKVENTWAKSHQISI